jgi:hypothetical protein
MKITLTITEEDVRLAQMEYGSAAITQCCPVFQAMKRTGLGPIYVWDISCASRVHGRMDINHDFERQRVTCLPYYNWPSAVGVEVELESPE